ncbi:hypothetical protein CBQ26_00660 [Deinococcus indicus]|uniref:Uncharacterized protein n=2 Tax=Deinococcus indicus TaxID=223556 RepID=A0A246BTM3_9DEIO|nr:hypothetical protein CBQ26_00660 [Deinococcus indicus]
MTMPAPLTALLARWRARRALRRVPPELRVLHALATGVTYPPLIASTYHLTLAQTCGTLAALEGQRIVRRHAPRPHLDSPTTLQRYELTLSGETYAAKALLPGLRPGTPVAWKGQLLCIRPGQHLLSVAALSPITAHLEGRPHP